MKPVRIRLRHITLGYPMRIELMIAESQSAVLPLNYGHHIGALSTAGLGGNLVAETFASADTRILLPR